MEYKFELHDAREVVLKMVADESRNANDKHELKSAKFDVQRVLRRTVEPKQKSRTEVASEFGTIFDNAVDIVTGKSEIEIDEMPPILDDHDGKIAPSEIDGEAVEVIRSGNSGNIYPVYRHSSGYRVCSCPSQKYGIICKHTLARIIERNWKGKPAESVV